VADNKWLLEFMRSQQKVKQAATASAVRSPAPPGVGPVSTVRFSDSENFFAKIKAIGGFSTYIGIPAASARNRSSLIAARADKFSSPRKAKKKIKNYLLSISKTNRVSNAQILFWFSKGSYIRQQPARPVLEPAIHADGNKQEISDLVAQAVKAELAGQHYKAKALLTRAGARAAKAARDWFTDSRNDWAENARRTEQRKGRNAPGLDTQIMRGAITHVEKETQ